MDIEKLDDHHYHVFCGDNTRANKFKELLYKNTKYTEVREIWFPGTVEVIASLTEVKQTIKAVNEAFV